MNLNLRTISLGIVVTLVVSAIIKRVYDAIMGIGSAIAIPDWLTEQNAFSLIGGAIIAVVTIYGIIGLMGDPSSKEKSKRIATTVLTIMVVVGVLQLLLGAYLSRLWAWLTFNLQWLVARDVVTIDLEWWHIGVGLAGIFLIWTFITMTWMRILAAMVLVVGLGVTALVTFKEEIKQTQETLGELLPTEGVGLPNIGWPSATGLCWQEIDEIHLHTGKPSETVSLCANGGAVGITTGRIFTSISAHILSVTLTDGRVLQGEAIDQLSDRRDLCTLAVHRSLEDRIGGADCYTPGNITGNTTQFYQELSVNENTLNALGVTRVSVEVWTRW